MKKYYSILTAIAVLALAAMSCGIQFVGSNPTPPGPVPQNFNQENPVPQGPQNGNPPGPDNFDPGPQGQGPQNGNPSPQGPENGNPGPNPNESAPGGGQIVSFTADRTTLNKGECALLHWETQGRFEARLNGQPVPQVGQQQQCPTQTTVYELRLDIGDQMLTRQVTITVNGGNQAPQPITPTKPSKNKPGDPPTITVTAAAATFDLQATSMFVDKGHYLHIGVKNNSSYSGNVTYKVGCVANYRAGNTMAWSDDFAYESTSAAAAFNANQERWTNSKILLDQGVGFYKLVCTIYNNKDTNTFNNTIAMTVEVTP